VLQLPPQRRAAIGHLARVLQLRLEVRRRAAVLTAHRVRPGAEQACSGA
jgi:hypothetical protein